MAEITPEERVQKVKADLLENLEFEPEKVRNFFTSNIFTRTLAHLVGWTGKRAKLLRCTAAGDLKTAPTATGIEKYGVTSGDATDEMVSVPFGTIVCRIDIFIWDNPAKIKFTIVPTNAWGPEFEVPVGFYSVDMGTDLYAIKNKTPASVARYQVVGWW